MADNKLSLIVSFVGQDKLSGALRNIIGLGKSGTQALRPMFTEARKLKGEMAALDREIAGATGNITPLIERQKALAEAMKAVNSQIERQKRIVAIDADVAGMTAQAEALKSAGLQNVVQGAALASPFVLATASAMSFSSGMVDIQQKAELTNAETAKMAGNILAMARATHQLPEDMRAGVDALAGMGLDPRQAIQMIGPIGRLGTAFKVDLTDGANAAFANMNNLKVGLGETSKALDIMAAGGKLGAFEVKDMARWFPQLTAAMQALGQRGTPAVADLTAALQVAMNTAGSADEAANNIANLMSKINSPTTIKAFEKQFGVDLPAALKRFEAQGMTSMEAFAMAAQKATGGDMKKLGFIVEDRQAQMGLLALIQNMDKYRAIRAQIAGSSAGTVNAAFSQREAQDASVSWAKFNVAMAELGILVGTTLLPAATRFLSSINGMIASLSTWAQKNPQMASGLTTLAAGLIGAKIGFGVLQIAAGTLLGPFAAVWGVIMKWRALGALTAVFPQITMAFFALRAAAIFLAQGVMRAGLMMLANPMVLAIVAIGAAIGVVAYLVYTNWDKIKAAFGAGWAWVKSTLAAAPAWLAGIGSAMMNGLLSMIDPFGLAKRLLAVAQNGVGAFKNFLGIKSPSRLMMAMGGHVAGGLALGIDRGAQGPLRSMGRMAASVAGAGALSLAGPSLASPGLAGGGAAPGGGGLHIGSIVIQQQPGEDGEALADRIIRRLKAEQARTRRSSFQDDF